MSFISEFLLYMIHFDWNWVHYFFLTFKTDIKTKKHKKKKKHDIVLCL